MAILSLSTQAPAAAPLRSGVYEELTLGVTADGGVTGAFFEERGTEPHFSCAFFFAGRIGADGRATVVAGDAVGLLQRRAGWLQVAYVSDAQRVSRGWIRADEAAPLAPPRSSRTPR